MTRKVKFTFRLPLLTTVTVIVTLWPIVTLPLGATMTVLMLGTAETTTLTGKLCETMPLVAVTVIVYVPGAVDDDEDALRTRLATEPGTMLTRKLDPLDAELPINIEGAFAAGETGTVTFTVPVSPKLLRVMLDVEEPPGRKLKLPGLALRPSAETTVTLIEAE